MMPIYLLTRGYLINGSISWYDHIMLSTDLDMIKSALIYEIGDHKKSRVRINKDKLGATITYENGDHIYYQIYQLSKVTSNG